MSADCGWFVVRRSWQTNEHRLRKHEIQFEKILFFEILKLIPLSLTFLCHPTHQHRHFQILLDDFRSYTTRRRYGVMTRWIGWQPGIDGGEGEGFEWHKKRNNKIRHLRIFASDFLKNSFTSYLSMSLLCWATIHRTLTNWRVAIVTSTRRWWLTL